MTKWMFALTEVSGDTLRAADFAAGMGRAGVSRYQLNVDDSPVAGALRLADVQPAITAVISIWDGDPAAATGWLAHSAHLIGGWTVEEHTPLPPRDTAPGERLDALAQMVLLRRPAALSAEEWQHRWLVEHTPIAIETQATFGYVQNLVVGSVVPGSPPTDALVEEHFPMAALTDPHEFYGSGGDDAELASRMERLMASVQRIGADSRLDIVPSSRYVIDC